MAPGKAEDARAVLQPGGGERGAEAVAVAADDDGGLLHGFFQTVLMVEMW